MKKTKNNILCIKPERIIFLLLLLSLTFIFSGCTEEEKEDILSPNQEITDPGNENPVPDNNTQNSTPTNLTPQAQAFQDSLHNVLIDQCGGCHSGAVDEPENTPDFAHENASTAYTIVTTNSLADLDNVMDSRLIQKILLQHQCTDQTCDMWVNELQAGIEDWATSMGTITKDSDPVNETPDNNGVDSTITQTDAFTNNLHSVLINRCGTCHAGLDSDPEGTPDFAQQDSSMAFSVISSNALVDLNDPASSRLVEKVMGEHKCVQPACDAWAGEVQAGIEAWVMEAPPTPPMEENPDPSTDPMDPVIEPKEDPMPMDAQVIAFSNNLHSTLIDYCGSCHAGVDGEPVGTPDFAHQDVNTAYTVVAANTMVNLGNPANSRLVQKVLSLHKCTQPGCDMIAGQIQSGVSAWADAVAGTETGAGTSGMSIASSKLTLADGTKNDGAGRVEDAIIAKYDFKTGTGTTAFDTSGVMPALDLTLSADVNWVAGRGIEITDPNAAEVTKAAGTVEASKKLFDMIAGPEGSGQYTIEAWIINDNTALDGPARIVSYSSDAANRNFTMGQVTSYYNFRNRSDMTGNNGSQPALESDNNAGDLKAQLQHVVFTFDTTNGRNIFVNGIKVNYDGVETDPAVPADISNWNDTYTFVLANEIADNVKRQWLGTFLFVGIHNRALTAEEILQNTLEGVGDKFTLEFDVSEMLDTSGATSTKVSMEVSELDAYSYVFGKPTLITDIPVPNIPVKNIRIAVNDNVPAAAQAFRNIDAMVTSSDTKLSSLGAVIPKDTGVETDMFSLVFEVLGNNSNVIVEQNPQPVPDMSVNDPSPEFGIRTFAQINNTMAVLTGVDKSVTRETYQELEQQLPGTPQLGSFVSANQIGIAKLSLEYCDALVESADLRNGFFGNTFEFNSPVVTAFSDQTKRDIVIDNLVTNMIGSDLTTQPTLAEVKPEVNSLIDQLSANCAVAADCDAARTRTIVKSACASVLASAAVSID